MHSLHFHALHLCSALHVLGPRIVETTLAPPQGREGSSSYEASLAPPQGMDEYYTDPSYSGRSVLVYLRWANGELAPGDYPNADTGRYCTRKIEEFMQHLDEGVLTGIFAARDDYGVGGRYQLLWGNTCSMTATITSCRTSASRRTPSSSYVTWPRRRKTIGNVYTLASSQGDLTP